MFNKIDLKEFCTSLLESNPLYMNKEVFINDVIQHKGNLLDMNYSELVSEYDYFKIIEFFIVNVVDWAQTKESVFYTKVKNKALLEDKDEALAIINHIEKAILNVDLNNLDKFYIPIRDLYKVTAWGLGYRPGTGRGFMPKFKMGYVHENVITHAILRFLKFTIKHKLKLIPLHNSNTNYLKDFSINVTEENKIISLQLSGTHLTNNDIVSALIKHILYREKNKSINIDELGIIIYNPFHNITHEVKSGFINPIILDALSNIILKERNSCLVSKYQVGDSIELTELSVYTTVKLTITKVFDNIAYAKSEDNDDIIGFSSRPGIWWYEDSVYVDNELFNVWQKHGLTKEEQKIYFDTLKYSYFIYDN